MAFFNFTSLLWWLAVVACVVCCCIKARMRYARQQEDRANLSRRVHEQITAARAAQAAAADSPDSQSAEDLVKLRKQVLQVIFPEQKIPVPPDIENKSSFDSPSDEENGRGRRNQYDTLNPVSEMGACSICLDNFAPGDSIITAGGSTCSHSFHRACVMDWIEVNDECPNCRQPMWDSETYCLVEQEIINHMKSSANIAANNSILADAEQRSKPRVVEV